MNSKQRLAQKYELLQEAWEEMQRYSGLVPEEEGMCLGVMIGLFEVGKDSRDDELELLQRYTREDESFFNE